MATPPTFVDEQETVWNVSTTPKTVSGLSVQAGDILVACGVTADSNGADDNITISGGTGVTWTLKQRHKLSSNTGVVLYTGACASTNAISPTVQITNNPSVPFGASILQFRGSDGVGATNKANGSASGPSVANVNTGDNSAIVTVNGDWSASTAARTWRTVNGTTPTAGNGFERAYFADGTNYGVYVAYWPDAGAAGSKTVGLTAPNQTWTIASVEIFGTSAAADDTLRGGTMGEFAQGLDGRLWF